MNKHEMFKKDVCSVYDSLMRCMFSIKRVGRDRPDLEEHYNKLSTGIADLTISFLEDTEKDDNT